MIELIRDKLLASAKESESLYHRLVLLVGPPGSGKTIVLNKVAEKLGRDIINVNLELSECLLEMTSRKRTLKISGMFDEILSNDKQIVILDNIEILFDVELKQDPLSLLQKSSRNRTIIASWSGKVKNKKLIYAEPGHPEYRTYNTNDFLIVAMDKNNH
ncbi:MAG: BREX-3 system P-loop-containing protein BrxF [Thermodesulfobacteriota bacterium]|nr:BREX-3 system P-loop-containing protein BrxF [Thermodesulfobacteriota bacterium]